MKFTNTGAEKAVIRDIQAFDRRIKAEIEVSTETVTMSYADQNLVKAPNPLLVKINGIDYVLELNKPTKVHPDHKWEVESRLGRHINPDIIKQDFVIGEE